MDDKRQQKWNDYIASIRSGGAGSGAYVGLTRSPAQAILDKRQENLVDAKEDYERAGRASAALGTDTTGTGPKNFLDGALRVLTTPGNITRGALLADDFGDIDDNIREAWNGKHFGFGDTDLLKVDKDDDSFGMKALKLGSAFVADVATDPLSWFTGGSSAIAKPVAAELLEASGKAIAAKAAERGGEQAIAAATKRGLADTSQRALAKSGAARLGAKEADDIATDLTAQAAGGTGRNAGDVIGAEMAEAFLKNGNFGVRKYLESTFGKAEGFAMWKELPRALKGGAGVKGPLGKDANGVKRTFGVGGGGRVLEATIGENATQAVTGTLTAARNRARTSKFGGAISARLGGEYGALYNRVIEDLYKDTDDLSRVGFTHYTKVKQLDKAYQQDLYLMSQNSADLTLALTNLGKVEGVKNDDYFKHFRNLLQNPAAVGAAAPDVLPASEKLAYENAQTAVRVMQGEMKRLFQEAGELNIGRSEAEISEYVARVMTKEAKAALKSKRAIRGMPGVAGRAVNGYDPTAKRQAYFKIVGTDDKGNLQLQYDTLDEINDASRAGGGPKVFEDDPILIFQAYQKSMTRAIAKARLNKSWLDAGLGIKDNAVSELRFDPSAASALITENEASRNALSDLLSNRQSELRDQIIKPMRSDTNMQRRINRLEEEGRRADAAYQRPADDINPFAATDEDIAASPFAAAPAEPPARTGREFMDSMNRDPYYEQWSRSGAPWREQEFERFAPELTPEQRAKFSELLDENELGAGSIYDEVFRLERLAARASREAQEQAAREAARAARPVPPSKQSLSLPETVGLGVTGSGAVRSGRQFVEEMTRTPYYNQWDASGAPLRDADLVAFAPELSPEARASMLLSLQDENVGLAAAYDDAVSRFSPAPATVPVAPKRNLDNFLPNRQQGPMDGPDPLTPQPAAASEQEFLERAAAATGVNLDEAPVLADDVPVPTAEVVPESVADNAVLTAGDPDDPFFGTDGYTPSPVTGVVDEVDGPPLRDPDEDFLDDLADTRDVGTGMPGDRFRNAAEKLRQELAGRDQSAKDLMRSQIDEIDENLRALGDRTRNDLGEIVSKMWEKPAEEQQKMADDLIKYLREDMQDRAVPLRKLGEQTSTGKEMERLESLMGRAFAPAPMSREAGPKGQYADTISDTGLVRLGEDAEGSLTQGYAGPYEWQEMYTNEAIRNIAEKYYMLNDPRAVNTFIDDFYKPYFTLFKTWATVGRGPGYHVRNLIGGTYNNWIAGVSGADTKLGAQLTHEIQSAQRYAKQIAPDDPEEARILFRQQLENKLSVVPIRDNMNLWHAFTGMEEEGIFRGMQVIDDLQLNDLARFGTQDGKTLLDRNLKDVNLFRGRERDELNLLQRGANKGLNNGWIRFGSTVGEMSETMLRGSAFIRGLRDHGVVGKDGALADGARQASLITKSHHFDYQDLSDFERNVMKNLLPFYVWTRNNVPLQFRAMMTDPGKIVNLVRANDSLKELFGADEETTANSVLPEWTRERMGWVTGFNAGKNPITASIESPAMDLNKFFNWSADPREAIEMKNLLSGANPLGKALVENVTEQNSFTGAEWDPQGVEAPLWGKILSAVPGVPDTTTDTEGKTRMNSRLYYTLRGLTPPLGLSEALLPVGQTEAADEKVGTSYLSSLLGVPVSTLTPQAQSSELRNRTSRLFEDQERAMGELGLDPETIQDMVNAKWPTELIQQYIEEGYARRKDSP